MGVEKVLDADAACLQERLVFAAFMLGPLLVGMSVAYYTRNDVVGWYQQVRKPTGAPPDWLYGPAWTALYVTMGYAAYRVFETSVAQQSVPLLAIVMFGVQFVLNQCWSLCFFSLKRWDVALLDISLLWLAILGTALAFAQIERLAGLLLTPYLGFVSVAALLNIGFIRENRQSDMVGVFKKSAASTVTSSVASKKVE
ncbi:Tryptophan-rich protein TspO [Porphyridium purpureum]|uniref:Tryptophan-rich protein TspO n=1 Tax=Porphyridium purpureum TaxID=35688 RepID=A0A5J4Z798_PORPP|nr:Tryptophan-rich protein TspO [Porphyridium purpureum]|eukprot:POR4809..scf295_1